MHAPWLFWFMRLLYAFWGHKMATPAEHHEPVGQGSHSSALVRPLRWPTVPAVQAVGAELPAAQKKWAGHGVGSVVA